MSGIIVAGTVLKVDRRAGNFNNDRGESIAYDYTLARVLTEDDVVEVKFRNDRPDAPAPRKGEEVAILVELPGNAKVTATGYLEPAALSALAS